MGSEQPRGRIIFWGATGQAKVLRECLGGAWDLVAIFDNNPAVPPPFRDVPLYYGWAGFQAWWAAQPTDAPLHFLVAIGGDRGVARLEIQQQLEAAGVRPATAIHRTAFVAANAQLGAGSQVLAHAAVCVEAVLGPGCIVNTAASVDHECQLGAGVHVAPGAHLAGEVHVGPHVMIGTGAAVLPRVRIGANSVVGAGAVVVRDVPADVVVVGAPARILKAVGT